MRPFLFNIYTSDFRYKSESCHVQKFSDDTSIVGCVESGQEEHRGLVDCFVMWCGEKHFHVNVAKTKEIVVDFRKKKAPPSLV